MALTGAGSGGGGGLAGDSNDDNNGVGDGNDDESKFVMNVSNFKTSLFKSSSNLNKIQFYSIFYRNKMHTIFDHINIVSYINLNL